MKKILQELVSREQGYVELRWHKRTQNSLVATKGRVDVANYSLTEGVGVRALVKGSWGFAATSDASEAAIKRAIMQAQANAMLLSKARSGIVSGGAAGHNEQRVVELRAGRLSTQDFVGPGFFELQSLSVADKLGHIIDLERQAAAGSSFIHTAIVRYSEYLEEKAIVTSDGACCSLQLAQPEINLTTIAEKAGQRATATEAAGVSGGWKQLFAHPSLHNMVENAVQLSVDLVDAKYPEGGRKKVILAPAVVGLLCHEAIGHTVEADFVRAGSVAAGKIGHEVASQLVTLADSGCETIAGYAVGNMPFDDEGIETENTVIIREGKLVSYLHNRETAAEFGVNPTGNARAWLFSDEPIIRMRNTYIMPGKSTLNEIIASTDDGLLIEGAGSGQADSNGEFMFGSGNVWRIKNGKKQELMREATISGIAFDVLKTVDAVSSEFRWDLGTGLCGKGQPAKVDSGGPYIRCEINVGGRQQ